MVNTRNTAGLLTATVIAAALTLTGCSSDGSEPETASPDTPVTETQETTPAPEEEAAKVPDADLAELLEPASALGEYDERWVAEWNLPKIPNYEINLSVDRTEATAAAYGSDEVFALMVGGTYAPEVIPEYEAALEQLGWTSYTETAREMAGGDESIYQWGKYNDDKTLSDSIQIVTAEPSADLEGHMTFEFLRTPVG